MPNLHQLAFVGAFVLTLGTLTVISTTAVKYFNLFPPPPEEDDTAYFAKALNMAWGNSAIEVGQNVWKAQPQLVSVAVGSLAYYIFMVLFLRKKRTPVLHPTELREFPLQEKRVISPNTALYRFTLPNPGDVLGLPIGQHISIAAEIDGKTITRSYTPTSSDDDMGFFDLIIKTYDKGNISKYVSKLSIGQTIKIKGPKGQFKYDPSLASEIGMIAGGTGITPMLQIIHAVLKNPYDQTKLSLIYANVNPEDILLRVELDDLAARWPARFNVYYVLNNPPPVWEGGVGFVSKEMIKERLPAPADNIKILMCGPPPMNTAMKKHLAELNYAPPKTVSKLEDQVFVF